MTESFYQFIIEIFKVYMHLTTYELVMSQLQKIRGHYEEIQYSMRLCNEYGDRLTKEEYVKHTNSIASNCKQALEGIPPENLPHNRFDVRDIVQEYTDKYIYCTYLSKRLEAKTMTAEQYISKLIEANKSFSKIRK